METCHREQSTRIRRIRPPGVTGLELWDLWTGDRILWDCMGQANFGQVLCEALQALQSGGGATRSEGPVPTCLRGFTHVYLTGGGAGAVKDALLNGPWHLYVDDDPSSQSIAHPGGDALLAAYGLSGWTVDLGQSALKISSRYGNKRWPRDLSALPVRTSEASQDVFGQRERLRDFMSQALLEYGKGIGARPEGIVFALPSRLDDAGVPEGSSYIGMGGDGHLVADVLQLAGLKDAEALLLNDAELAAVSAQTMGGQLGRTLVLTIGFGVGAALVE